MPGSSVPARLRSDPPAPCFAQVLYLDEPTTGMDPISRRHVWDIVGEQGAWRRCPRLLAPPPAVAAAVVQRPNGALQGLLLASDQ